MKNLTLAKRIAIGFGVVLGITILLGALSVFEMRSGSRNAHKLSDQYVPEVSICGDLQAATLNTMLAVRSFGYTSDGKFHEQAQAGMTEMQQTIQTAKDLVSKYPNLVKLKEGMVTFEKGYAEFAGLAADTKKQSDAVNHTQASLNASAAKFVAQMESFQNEQEQLMRADIKAGAPADKLEERALKLELSAELRTLMNQIRIAVWKAQAERDLNVAQAALPKFADLEKGLGRLTPVTHLEQHKQKLLEMQIAAKTYQEEVTNLVSHWTALNAVGVQRAKVSTALAEAADEIAAVGVQRTTEVANDSAKKMDAASFLSMLGVGIATVLGIIATVLGIILAWLITRGISRVVVGIAQSLAMGADQTAVAAGQVSSASQTLAEGASESAASLEETSASLEEMSSMTQRNAGNAQQANGLAKAARAAAEQGNQDMTEMTQAMAAIKASSDDIAKILKTIDEIAFQTNLLALNAAVEAARAGEAGAGFAVVADEVRSLAQRAAGAAKETATKIDGAITRSEQGVEISNKVAVTLTEIVAKVRQVDELVAAVSGASTEQSQGISQINTAVTQMDKVTQSNAASAEESAAAAEELNAQADAMKVAVGELQRLVSGTSRGGAGVVVSAPKAGKRTTVGITKPVAVKGGDRLEGNSSLVTSKPGAEVKVGVAANVPAEFMNF